MKKLATILLILASQITHAVEVNRTSNPQLYPTMDPIIAYQQNELVINVRLPYHTNLTPLTQYTLGLYTNSALLETFLPTNLYGTLSVTGPVYTVIYVIPESDMTMPPKQYLFEGKGGNTLLFSTVLDVKPSGGTNIVFNGPYYGPYNTVYVAGRGWIPFNQASNGTPTLAEVLAEGGSTDISGLTGYLASNLVGPVPGSTEFQTNSTVIGSGTKINLLGNWAGSYFDSGILHIQAPTPISLTASVAITGNTFDVHADSIASTGPVSFLGSLYASVTNFFAPILNFSNTFNVAVEANTSNYFAEGSVQATVTVETVQAGDVSANGNVNILGNIYSWTTNFFAPIFNISITNIIGAVENHINNYVYNTNIVNMVNNIGGVQVFQTNTLAFGYKGGTNNPYFVQLYSGDVLWTGVLDGANLRLYGPAGGGGLGTLTNLIATAPLVSEIIDGTAYVGWGDYTGLGLMLVAWTNTATYTFTGVTNKFVCYTTSYVAHIWGAAGSSAAGGYTEINFTTTNNEILNIVVGQGGLCVTSPATIVTNTGSAFGGGGIGYARGGAALGGGGLSGIQRSNGEWLGIAGGGGGQNSGYGGGLSGGTRGAANDGFGGTQTAGGTPIAAFPYSNYIVTNFNGTAFRGGDGSITNNSAINQVGNGGGSGSWGGSGTYLSGYPGGGSGLVSTNVIGVTIRASATTPPNNESPYYPLASPAIGANGASTHKTRGGNGAIVLRAAVPL